MDRNYANIHYLTERFDDFQRGGAGLNLFRKNGDKKARVAEIFYWDANGSFSLETLGEDVPLDIVEEMIVEAKATIKFK